MKPRVNKERVRLNPFGLGAYGNYKAQYRKVIPFLYRTADTLHAETTGMRRSVAGLIQFGWQHYARCVYRK